MGENRTNAKVIIGIVLAIVVLVLGTMLVIGLVQGDEVDREENPVRGAAHTLVRASEPSA